MDDIDYKRDLKIDTKNLKKELEYLEATIYYKYSKHYMDLVKKKEKAKVKLDIAKQKDELEKKYAEIQLSILAKKDEYEYKLTKDILHNLVLVDVRYSDAFIKYQDRVKKATDEHIDAKADEVLAHEMLKKIFQRSKKIELLIQLELKGL